jgi:hypothetical protein
VGEIELDPLTRLAAEREGAACGTSGGGLDFSMR